jgi:hypothetical protein
VLDRRPRRDRRVGQRIRPPAGGRHGDQVLLLAVGGHEAAYLFTRPAHFVLHDLADHAVDADAERIGTDDAAEIDDRRVTVRAAGARADSSCDIRRRFWSDTAAATR